MFITPPEPVWAEDVWDAFREAARRGRLAAESDPPTDDSQHDQEHE